MLKELNKNDVFLLTSLWEGLPISLLEAMYMKKVCIVSDVIGNRDVIDNGRNGYVAKNIGEYINVINNVLRERNIEKIKNEEWNDMQKIYNTNNMVKEYKKEYGE